jgi:hypothetical protein
MSRGPRPVCSHAGRYWVRLVGVSVRVGVAVRFPRLTCSCTAPPLPSGCPAPRSVGKSRACWLPGLGGQGPEGDDLLHQDRGSESLDAGEVGEGLVVELLVGGQAGGDDSQEVVGFAPDNQGQTLRVRAPAFRHVTAEHPA